MLNCWLKLRKYSYFLLVFPRSINWDKLLDEYEGKGRYLSWDDRYKHQKYEEKTYTLIQEAERLFCGSFVFQTDLSYKK
jgi:hypothetical protein